MQIPPKTQPTTTNRHATNHPVKPDQAVPAGGGLLVATGKMWVSPAAEQDPRAISMQAVGEGLNAAALAAGYLPPVSRVLRVVGRAPRSDNRLDESHIIPRPLTNRPPSHPSAIKPQGTPPPPAVANIGPLNVRGSLEGSHLAPVTRAQWLAPLSGVAGSATFGPTRIAGELSGPAFNLRATADITSPNGDKARAADTQAEATYWGQPRVEGVELDGALAGADLSQLAAAPPPAAQPLQPQNAGAGAAGGGAASGGAAGDAAGGGALTSVQQQLQQQLGGAASSGAGAGGPGLMLPPGRADALQQQLSGGVGAASPSAAAQPSAAGGVLPLGSAPNAVKLKLSGRLRLSAKREESEARRRQQLGVSAGEAGGASSPYLFTGPLTLEGLRLNQLSLARFLAGDVALTEPRLLLRARGARADELMELDLALPLAAGLGGPGADGRIPAPIYWPEGMGPALVKARGGLGAGSGSGVRADARRPAPLSGVFDERRRELTGSSGGARGLSGGSGDGYGSGYGGISGPRGGREEEAEQRVSHVLLRRGGLYLSSTVNQRCSQVALAVEGLPLDELELGSLRGRLTAAALDVDLGARQGRASLSVAAPRFSGLRGTSASAAARWERDVVLIERASLTQAASRYELQAEYVLPPGLKLPESFAPPLPPQGGAAGGGAAGAGGNSLLHAGGAAGGGADGSAGLGDLEEEEGRWRVMLSVPGARIEELLPAGQLLQQATRRAASLDPFAAKRRFLGGLSQAVCTAAQEFRYQVDALLAAEQAQADAAARGGAGADGGSGAAGAAAATASGGSNNGGGAAALMGEGGAGGGGGAVSLPGLQELRGGWEGSVTAVGGGNAQPRVEFDVKGADWRWGDYTLDALVLRGVAHGAEGLALDELRLASGGATLAAGGQLLGPRQDATIAVDHLPAALLAPLYRALPALQVGPELAGWSILNCVLAPTVYLLTITKHTPPLNTQTHRSTPPRPPTSARPWPARRAATPRPAAAPAASCSRSASRPWGRGWSSGCRRWASASRGRGARGRRTRWRPSWVGFGCGVPGGCVQVGGDDESNKPSILS